MRDLYPIPTGYLFVDTYERGRLETLSIADYGKHYNVKADFLGYTRPINGVPNVACQPLSSKWVITLSTQYGCPMRCNFCDVPQIDFNGNVSYADLKRQLYTAISLFPGTRYTERLNIHFARMGDPIFNPSVFDFSRWAYESKSIIAKETGLSIETLHPVLTTSSPRKLKSLQDRLLEWTHIKNDVYNGQAGLQLSINSTSEEQRTEMFGDMQTHLADLSKICDKLPMPTSRKYCLNFAYASSFEVDGSYLANLFDPAKFMCKITPIHNNNACRAAGLLTINGYAAYAPYQDAEASLLKAGFDVLVFVPSSDEEHGLVTCGNAILGGSSFRSQDAIINIQGTTPSSVGGPND